MKILVIGSGGREHAIAWKLAQSPRKPEIFCLPGNPGMAEVGTNVNLSLNDLDAVASWAEEHKIDITVVGPEAPLAAGIVDVFNKRGLKIFGPTQAAAQMEASKSFAKEIMLAAKVQTAKGAVFEDFEAAKSYVEKQGAPIVVKADGLAAGKGVVVAETVEEAVSALKSFMLEGSLGKSGAKIVIENCLIGKEASIIAIVEGETVVPMVVSQDHKRINDGDQGANTGGMGAVSPTPVFPDSRVSELVETIFQPTLKELAKRGIYYSGFLYAGILVTADGKANVIEFNCRCGDPETQVIMMRMDSDLLDIIEATVEKRLDKVKVSWKKDAAACIVISSRGYPAKVDDGKVIHGLFPATSDSIVFQAGTKYSASKEVVSSGGRVLGVTALGNNLEQALDHAYLAVSKISFDGAHYRKDIGRTR